ncbi:MAG: antibiotic biosynthesis monooxygenase [Pseudomonadota bacterium]|nr:antibiotic biosynthesis monooxygenase [Pseudomonadota bacterium]
MTKNIYWTLSANVKDQKIDDLEILVNNLLRKTKTEIGCLNYEFWFSEDKKKLYVFERYADADACLTHIKNIAKDLPTFFDCVDMDPIIILGDATIAVKKAFNKMNASYTKFFKGHTA